jgi:hypothetical protein
MILHKNWKYVGIAATMGARSAVGLPVQQDFFGFRVVREPAVP